MRYDNQDLLHVGEQMLGKEHFGGCTLAEYQKYLLEILCEIDRICKKNNILYFLMYGSLIGAVRHKGFVPWDDDADIVMTRADFYKFQECCKKELSDQYDLVTYNDDENYNYTFPKLRRKNTTYIIVSEISRHGRNAGFFIDIIIMDYVPTNRYRAFIQRRALMALHRLVSPGFLQSEIGLNALEEWLVNFLRKCLGRKKIIGLLEKLIYTKNFENSRYLISEIFLPETNYFYLYDRYHFERSEGLPFEDVILQVPIDPISLLHKCYFKGYMEKNIILQYSYENEIEAIKSGKCIHINDIMFIPKQRSRDRHQEIVFDCNHGSSYYDSQYFKKMDKIKNDKWAVDDRKNRKKGRDAAAVLKNNEKIVRESCEQTLLVEYLAQIRKEYPDTDKTALDKLQQIYENILEIGTASVGVLELDIQLYILRVLIRLGQTGNARRFALYIENRYPEVEINTEKKKIDFQMDVFYAVFEGNDRKIDEYLNCKYDDYLTIIVDGVFLYMKGCYKQAEQRLKECLTICDSVFWAHYYLGLIELYDREDRVEAKKLFCRSLDDTNFMPQLKMALEQIRKLENA